MQRIHIPSLRTLSCSDTSPTQDKVNTDQINIPDPPITTFF